MLKSRTLTDLEHIREKGEKSQFLHHVCMLSHFSNVWLFVTLWTVAFQVPLSMGFSRQEYQVGCHAHLQGDLPVNPVSPVFPALAGRFFTISATWEAPFLHHIDRIQFLEAVGLRSSFSCWVSAGAHLQLLEVSCVPCHRATSIFKPAMVRWIFLMLLFSTFLHLWPLDLD